MRKYIQGIYNKISVCTRRSTSIVHRVMRPVHRMVQKQPVPVRYTVGGFSVVFGMVNLINPFIPGLVLIYAGIDILVKTKKGYVHVHADRVSILKTGEYSPVSLLSIRDKAPLTYRQGKQFQSALYSVLCQK